MKLLTGAALTLVRSRREGRFESEPFISSELPAMKITGIEAHVVNMGRRGIPFVTVGTDEGITGIGEAYSCGPDLATVEVVRDFESWLLGRDPRDIEGLWQLMYAGTRFPGGMVVNAAISGIEHALWDISGKAAGLPVYRLLGGKAREKVKVYQSVGGSTPAELKDRAQELVERYGYKVLKMNPLPPDWQNLPWSHVLDGTAARVGAVREAVGPGVEIGLDPHAQLFEVTRAAQICRAVAPFRPMFVEEALRPENLDAWKSLKDQVDVPLATGEMLYTRHQFLPLLSRYVVDYIQPDVCVAGGLWEMKKIASLAETHYVSVAPHNPCGPLANAVNAHFALSTQNFEVLEYQPDDAGVRRQVLQEPLPLRDGYLHVPDTPGLGVELDMEFIRSSEAESWHRQFLRRSDGSLAYQ